jgi:signal transduction histidine kinase
VTRRLFEPLVLDPAAKRPLLPVRGTGGAFVAAVGGAIVATSFRQFSRMPSWERIAFVALGLAMVLLALLWTSRRRSAVAAYWTFQALAATLLTLASRGHGGLVVLPVLAQTVFLAPRRFLLLFGAFLAGVTVVATRARAVSWLSALDLSAGHLAGIVFVVAFTEILLRERQARERNERFAVELATARERARIARDVHDILGHSLTALHAQVTGAFAVRERDPERSTHLLNAARALAEDGLREVRASVSALREGARAPLAAELRSLLAIAETTGLDTQLVLDGAPAIEPSATTALSIYRIVQECITNSIRHGEASRVTVTLTYGEADLCVRVEDDGRGADDLQPGAGLNGVRERVALLGGDIAIETRPGAGLRLEARVPFTSASL